MKTFSDEYTVHSQHQSVMPWGNTLPQSYHGDEILKVTCTPTTEHVRVDYRVASWDGEADQGPVAAAFKGASCIDVSGRVISNTIIAMDPIGSSVIVPVTPNEETEFSLRVGPRSTGSIFLNGSPLGQFWPSRSRSILVVQEIDLGEA